MKSFLALLLVCACGGAATSTPDAGPDAGADGGADAGPTAILVDPDSYPIELAIDQYNVYWTQAGIFEGDGKGKIGKRQLGAGGQPSDLALALVDPSAMALDADNVYWTSMNTDGGVYRTAKTGGAPVALAGQQPRAASVAVDTAGIYWSTWGDPQQPGTGKVFSAHLDGSARATLASGLSYPRAVAADSTAIYFVSGAGVTRVPKSGAGPSVIATTARNQFAASLGLDGDSLYFGDRDGAILKVPKAGGAQVTVAAAMGSPSHLAIDAAERAIYWTLVAPQGPNHYGAVYKAPLSGGTATLVTRSFGISGFGESAISLEPGSVWFGADRLFKAAR